MYAAIDSFITVDPAIRSGKPVVKGTGFPVSCLLAELADGHTIHEIAEDLDLDMPALVGVLQTLDVLFNQRGDWIGRVFSTEGKTKDVAP